MVFTAKVALLVLTICIDDGRTCENSVPQSWTTGSLSQSLAACERWAMLEYPPTVTSVEWQCVEFGSTP